ncbi:MAG: PilW family protein [Azonexus sp.]
MIKTRQISLPEAGLTLVELMVSMAIGLFLVGAVSTLYVKTRGGFDYANEVARIQETGRFAFGAIGRDIRSAGYNGCGYSSKTRTINILTDAATDPFLNFLTPIRGYNGSSYPSAMLTSGGDAPISGTDALILIGGDSSREMVVKAHVVPNITTATHAFKAGEILLGTDCAKASIFHVAGITATTVSHATGGTPANCHQAINLACSATSSSVSATLKPGSLLMPVFSNAYFIANSASGSTRSLWMMQMVGETDGTPTARELLVGVTDMQITYGIDSNNDGKIDSSTDSPSNWNQVASISIALTAESANTKISSTKGKITKTFNETFVARNRTQ